jgi:hypothetical protein
MTSIVDIRAKRSPSVKFAAGLAVVTLLALGTFAASASAQGYRGYQHGGNYHGYHRGWNGGYYPAPPLVYGEPYYAPPPMIYGPSVGIVVPGVAIGIQ